MSEFVCVPPPPRAPPIQFYANQKQQVHDRMDKIHYAYTIIIIYGTYELYLFKEEEKEREWNT